MTRLRSKKTSDLYSNSTLIAYLVFPLTQLLLLAGVCSMLPENPQRAAILIATLLANLILGAILKDWFYSSLLILLIVWPFNIAFQLPDSLFAPSPYVNGVYINYLHPTVSIIDLWVANSVVAALLSLNWLAMLKKNRYLVTFLFGYYVVHNVYFSGVLTLLQTTRILTLVLLAIVIIAEARISLTKFKMRVVGLLMVSGSIIQIAIGLAQTFGGASIGLSMLGESQIANGLYGSSFVEFDGDLILRAYGTFPHPNLFAGFLLSTMLITMLLIRKNLVSIKLGYIILGIIGLGLLLTFSKSALLLGAIVLLLLLPLNRIYRSAMFVMMLIVGGILLYGLGREDLASTFYERIDLMKSSFELMRENLWMGVGWGEFVRALGGLEQLPRTGRGLQLLQPVHNVFALILAENGLLFGGTIILTYLLAVIRHLKVLLSRDYFSWVFGWTAFLVVAGVGMVDHYLITLPQGVFLLTLITLIASVPALDLESK